jgi:hypothetical protein
VSEILGKKFEKNLVKKVERRLSEIRNKLPDEGYWKGFQNYRISK